MTRTNEHPNLPHLMSAPDSAAQGGTLRLADFIRHNTPQIISEWESFARSLEPAASSMTPLALRDHIEELLDFIVQDIQTAESSAEQFEKSIGNQEKSPHVSAAETHAALRLAGGFNIAQMVAEYRALRASVIKLWSKSGVPLNAVYINDITRFNEAIDQEMAESVGHYANKVSYSKDLFMGVLSHDLRTPLNVISMSAQLLLKMGDATDRQTTLATQIFESNARITSIVNDLLDVTRARFGSGMSVNLATMDMGEVGQQIVSEIRVAHPSCNIMTEISGDLKGKWDKARIGQVFSNLIGNAVQYGSKGSPITVTITANKEDVVLSIHNFGPPIPPEKFAGLFDALTRASVDDGEHPMNINLGLGLFITQEIVDSHGGTIKVTSTKEEGTAFTLHFPKQVEG